MSRKWLLSTLILPACIILMHSIIIHHHDEEKTQTSVSTQPQQEHFFCLQKWISTLVNQDQGEGHCENFVQSHNELKVKKTTHISSFALAVIFEFEDSFIFSISSCKEFSYLQFQKHNELTPHIPPRAPPAAA